MTYCSKCGAALRDGAKFCTECGAPLTSVPARTLEPLPQAQPAAQTQAKSKPKKPLYRRWWVWAAVIVIIVAVVGKRGGRKAPEIVSRQAETVATARPAPTTTPTRQPTTTPKAEPTKAPEAPAVTGNAIRPEIKEFLDAYEACMDEYVEFMQKYMNADATSLISMMGDYYRILASYAEYTEKLDALDESEFTSAELAYYLEVTNRVSRKLLTVAAD